MKRYWIFAGDNYYPNGGIGDFMRSFDDVDETIAFLKNNTVRYDWAHIVDTQSLAFPEDSSLGPEEIFGVNKTYAGERIFTDYRRKHDDT